MKTELKNIPTTIITGFLGAGKTSAILHLLNQRPKNETWAVLVNEYGAAGVDADILSGNGAHIEQVPGGCICCAQGLPFEVAINRLIKTARPDRLIIEPSGLAHPHKIIVQLSKGYFKELLSLQAVICLVDPRHLENSQYFTNEMFVDQIALSDIVLGNKNDLINDDLRESFRRWVSDINPKKLVVEEILFGKFKIEYLNLKRNLNRRPLYPNSHIINTDAFSLTSWSMTYSPTVVFDIKLLVNIFEEQEFIRLKAVLNTNVGWFVFNQVGGELSYNETTKRQESRIEILGNHVGISMDECCF